MSIFTFFNDPTAPFFDDDFNSYLFENVFDTHTRALDQAPRGKGKVQQKQVQGGGRGFRPRLDLRENPDNTMTAVFELPGLKKEDVSIEAHNNLLTVSGETSEVIEKEWPKGKDKQDEGQQEMESKEKEDEEEAKDLEEGKQGGAMEESKEAPEFKWHIRERRYGKFSRTIQLPPGVNADQIKASFHDGLLTITFPKAPPEQIPKKIALSDS